MLIVQRLYQVDLNIDVQMSLLFDDDDLLEEEHVHLINRLDDDEQDELYQKIDM